MSISNSGISNCIVRRTPGKDSDSIKRRKDGCCMAHVPYV
jgi:hypothetical protein